VELQYRDVTGHYEGLNTGLGFQIRENEGVRIRQTKGASEYVQHRHANSIRIGGLVRIGVSRYMISSFLGSLRPIWFSVFI
jgi:hypothetical protein